MAQAPPPGRGGAAASGGEADETADLPSVSRGSAAAAVSMMSGVWPRIAVGEPNPRVSQLRLVVQRWPSGAHRRSVREAPDTNSTLCHKRFAARRQSLEALAASSFGRQEGVGAASRPRPSLRRRYAVRLAQPSAKMGGTAPNAWERTLCSDIHTLRRGGI